MRPKVAVEFLSVCISEHVHVGVLVYLHVLLLLSVCINTIAIVGRRDDQVGGLHRTLGQAAR